MVFSSALASSIHVGTSITWHSIFIERLVIVDAIVFGILALFHLLVWIDVTVTSGKAPNGLVDASSGGIQAVGILLPLSQVALQIGKSRSGVPLPNSIFLDVFISDLWLALSLALGLAAMSLIPYRRYPRVLGVLFGWQLFSFMVGLARLGVAIFAFTASA